MDPETSPDLISNDSSQHGFTNLANGGKKAKSPNSKGPDSSKKQDETEKSIEFEALEAVRTPQKHFES